MDLGLPVNAPFYGVDTPVLSASRLQKDFPYYSRSLLKIHSKTLGLVPFTLNNVQLKLNTIFEEKMKKGKVVLYLLKARQMGISTWCQGRIFHATHLFPYTKGFVIANDDDGARNVFNMSRLFLDCLPDEYRPMVRYLTKKELVFENPDEDERAVEPGLRSRLDVFTAGKDTAGRSFSGRVAHLSEFAFFPNPAPTIDSIVPTVPDAPGCFLFMETTGDQIDSYAHNLWLQYKEEWKSSNGETYMVPLFFPWFEHNDYQSKFDSPRYKLNFLNSLSSDDRAFMNLYKLSPEQMFWRANKIKEFGRNEERFMKEYPSDDTEAFLVTGLPVFPRKKINEAILTCKKALFYGEISPQGHLSENAHGRFVIFEKPQKGEEYILGVDPSGGKVDEAVIEVVKKRTLEQVAEWVGVVDPITLGGYVKAIGRLYTAQNGYEALVAIEINGSGISTQYEIMQDYWNLYRWKHWDNLKKQDSNKLGWETNVRTKPILIEFSTFCFSNDYCKVNSVSLLKEMSTFIRITDVKVAGDYSTCDNRVMAWMIALYVAGEGRTSFLSHLPTSQVSNAYERERKDVTEMSLLGRSLHLQCDTDNLPNARKRLDYEDSWLNY